MPNSETETALRWSAFDTAKVAQLDGKVSGLDADVKQINVRIEGVYKKIDAVADSLSHEMRTGMASLTESLSEKSTPKFGIIFAGLTLVTMAAGLIGGLAMSPMQSDIAMLKHEMVPRIEHDYRNQEYVERFNRNEAAVRSIEEAAQSDKKRLIDELLIENRSLKARLDK